MSKHFLSYLTLTTTFSWSNFQTFVGVSCSRFHRSGRSFILNRCKLNLCFAVAYRVFYPFHKAKLNLNIGIERGRDFTGNGSMAHSNAQDFSLHSILIITEQLKLFRYSFYTLHTLSKVLFPSIFDKNFISYSRISTKSTQTLFWFCISKLNPIFEVLLNLQSKINSYELYKVIWPLSH